jgi:N-acetylneuraminic acid mutarotase
MPTCRGPFQIAAVAALFTLAAQCDTGAGETNGAPRPLPKIAELPVGIASFGAAVDGDWLYVYGGHTGQTHSYSTEEVSNGFRRVNVRQDGAWEELPSGPALQGLVLVSHAGSLYRVGGMTARNKPGEADDLHSTADVARFDPQTRQWTALPPLPEGRSSHGAVVVDGRLYVVGGWQLRGAQEPRWHTTSLVLDLGAAQPEWKSLPKQPFERRALAVAEADGKLYVIGGLLGAGGISNDTDVFDLQSQAWSKGPPVPGTPMAANGVAACTLANRVLFSGIDGNVYGLDATGANWQVVGKLATPRFHHRLVAQGSDTLLAVAGATLKHKLRTVDAVTLSAAVATSPNSRSE